MKTIEERAKEYAPDPVGSDYILYTQAEYIANQQRNAYIAGAKDQQYVDKLLIEQLIDKVFEYARYDLEYCGNVRDILNYLKSLKEKLI